MREFALTGRSNTSLLLLLQRFFLLLQSFPSRQIFEAKRTGGRLSLQGLTVLLLQRFFLLLQSFWHLSNSAKRTR